MTGGGETQPLALQRSPRGHAGQGLERLEGGARQHGGCGIAVRGEHGAVGREDHRGTGVAGLDEPAAFHDGELDGGGGGERLGHPLSVVGARIRHGRLCPCLAPTTTV